MSMFLYGLFDPSVLNCDFAHGVQVLLVNQANQGQLVSPKETQALLVSQGDKVSKGKRASPDLQAQQNQDFPDQKVHYSA